MVVVAVEIGATTFKPFIDGSSALNFIASIAFGELGGTNDG